MLQTPLRGIDLSHNNKVVDFDAAKPGLDYAILRLGYGADQSDQDDTQYERNVAECERLGLPWGAYIYSYAMTAADAQSEIAHTLRCLKGKRPSYPIYIDMEDADSWKSRHGGIPDRQTNTDIIKVFCRSMETAGYFVGWYANKDWCDNHLYVDQLAPWAFWYARPGITAPDRPCGMWQDQIGETKGHWPGVKGNVPGTCDTNLCYEDYPELIKSKGLNGWGTPAPAPQPAPAPTPAPAPAPAPTTYTVNRQLVGYLTAADASARRNARGTVAPGTYSIYNTSGNMINVTRAKGQPGSWINPGDNGSAPAPQSTRPVMREGAAVQYSGPLYADSYGGGRGKIVSGTYKVDIYKPGRTCGVHLPAGWVPESACKVVG